MNRTNENDVKGLNLPDPVSTEVKFFGPSGKNVTEEDRVFAKLVSTSSGSVQYFLRVGRGELVDPYGADASISRGQLNSVFSFRKVGEKTFSFFLKYLETKNRINFTNARRLLLTESYK